MTRVFSAALLAVCGLTSVAPAQTFYSGTAGYTSYYAPAYTSYYAPAYTSYHAPATTSYYAPASYSNYSYQSNFGPLGVLGPRFWFGGARRSAAYASPFYGTAPAYTAAYSPVMTTSYYAPAADTTLAMASPVMLASNSCCTPCTACPTCPSSGCPGGNCSLNYAPTSGELKPEVDPNSSGASGSRTFGSESGGAGTGGATQPDNFRPYERERDEDGFGSGERGAGYRPESKIEKKAPAADLPDEAEPEAETPAGNEPAAEAPKNAPAGLSAPAADGEPDASVPALPNLDAKITAASPSLLRERAKMKARFGSPKLARAKVDPSTLPAAADVRLVRK